MRTLRSFATVASLSLTIAATAAAQTPTTTPRPQATPQQTPRPQTTPTATATPTPGAYRVTTPTAFVSTAMRTNTMEIEEARWASTNATNADVKAYAKQLLSDHEKSNADLKKMAGTKNWSTTDTSSPASTPEPTATPVSKQTSLSGAAIDRAYLNAQIAAHERAIAMFEAEARSGTDPELKAWASKQLPALRAHLQKARDLSKKIGGSVE
jgi:putative membrane protein